MTRFNDVISTPPVETDRGSIHIDRFTAMALGLILLIGALAVTAIELTPRDAAPATNAQLDGTDAGAANVVDGWALAGQRPEPIVADGWALAGQRPEPVMVDGWALSSADGN
jgi:hypothetical protein